MSWGILLAAWGYLMVGASLGRAVYVRHLGNEPRYNRHDRLTERAAAATSAAFFTFFGWPITLPFWLMVRPTPIERAQSMRQELEEAQKELERLEAQIRERGKL